VIANEKRVQQITALIEATVENVISTVDFPEEVKAAMRATHPSVTGRRVNDSTAGGSEGDDSET
jgi:hypothetical protein